MKSPLILLSLFFYAPSSWAAAPAIPCDIADPLAEKAYQRVSVAFSSSRIAVAIALSQSFWDIEIYAQGCPKVASRAKDMIGSGFEKDMRDTLSRAILEDYNRHNAAGISPGIAIPVLTPPASPPAGEASENYYIESLAQALHRKECGGGGSGGFRMTGGTADIAGVRVNSGGFFGGVAIVDGMVRPGFDFQRIVYTESYLEGKISLGNPGLTPAQLDTVVNSNKMILEIMRESKLSMQRPDVGNIYSPRLNYKDTESLKSVRDAAAAMRGEQPITQFQWTSPDLR
ncbi:MAG TPA: hypothetical protein VNQ97_10930 [Burkholderiaceae bacterium]|nr:hypothetical protein [Burkholderiaceae bacterium]